MLMFNTMLFLTSFDNNEGFAVWQDKNVLGAARGKFGELIVLELAFFFYKKSLALCAYCTFSSIATGTGTERLRNDFRLRILRRTYAM